MLHCVEHENSFITSVQILLKACTISRMINGVLSCHVALYLSA